MVSMKERRIKLGLTQPELAKSIDKDIPLISKFENFVCLPTPEDAKKIAKKLKCTTILEIYDEEDITFLAKKNKKRKCDELDCYKLTAILPREAINWLTKKNLQILGYDSIKDWANDCYKKFIKRVEKKKSRIDWHQNDSKNSMLSKTIQ